jgi:hypothetical protein
LNSWIDAFHGILAGIQEFLGLGLPLPLCLFIEIDGTRAVIVQGDPEVGDGRREGLGLLAIGLELIEAAARIHVELLIHNGLRGSLLFCEGRLNYILALQILCEILRRDFEDFLVEGRKGLFALCTVDLLDIVIEGSFKTIQLFFIQSLSLATLKVLNKELLKSRPVFLTKEGRFDRRTGTIHRSLLIP